MRTNRSDWRLVSETALHALPSTALLEVEHVTVYRYAAPVELAHHLAHLRPLDSDTQATEAFAMQVLPPPMHEASNSDWLGNHQTCFTVNLPHDELQVRAVSRVRVAAPPLLDADCSAPWDGVRAQLRYAAGRAWEPANEFVHASSFVPLLPALRDWAAPAFTPGRPVARVGLELMARLHADFRYSTDSTDVDTPLADVLERREGVCQDFAHLLIGALRGMGLAARYVSGYLLTTAPDGGAADAPWLGADASHAWAALWCPMADGTAPRWLELDPTNNVVPSTGHVRLAVGRDYGDVTPLRGVIRGGGEHQLEVRVRTVRVM
jgi:transglutaminase-like putative cysteine protease